MAKIKNNFACSECGAIASKWAGQCSDCLSWNTLTEVAIVNTKSSKYQGYAGVESEVIPLSSVTVTQTSRISTQLSELDRVLGGGIVPGSVILIGGNPGIGKSTLLLQAISALSETCKTLYVTGEESQEQVKLRAVRLGLEALDIPLVTATQVEAIIALANQEKPDYMVLDSIQTMYTEQVQSAPGSVAQVRESAAQIVKFAKQSQTAIFLVGHVTKEGAIAGPRVLEHMVDTVLYFDGDADGRFRMIRAVKNRFGAVNELGIFAMTDRGLREIDNPSAIFLSRAAEEVCGSAVMVTWEGSRPMLIEIQSLVDESHLANPRRVAVGLDQNRLALILAVLHRHGGIITHNQDVFVNIVGGVKITETGIDLPALLTILSSLKNKPLPRDLVIFGEIGLSGEVRPVQSGLERLKEAKKLGFNRAIVPKANLPKGSFPGMDVMTVEHISAALSVL